MTPQEELAALRRLAELEAKAGASTKPMTDSGATWGAGQSFGTGAVQGFGDEIMAGVAAAKEALTGGLPYGRAYDQALSMYRGARDKYREESPWKAGLSEAAGSLATAIPAGAAVMPARAGLAANAALGMAQGGVYGFAEGEGGVGERLASGATGAAIGGGLGAAVPAAAGAIGRAITPVRSQLTPEAQRLAGIAAQEGIDLTPAQISGSPALKTMESVFESLPMTGGPQQAIRDAQRQQFNRAVLKRAGIDADNAAPDVLQAAQTRLGGEFDRLASGNTVMADQGLLDDLARADASYRKNLPPDQQAIVGNYVNSLVDLMGQNGGAIDGTTYQTIRSQMTRRMRTATDPELRQALKDVRNSLDDAASRSISPDDAAAWDATRRQYANLKTIEKAMSNSQAGTAAGNIPPTALSGAVKQGSSDFARGGGDLNELARVGTSFVRDSVPNSGTAQRMMMQNLMTGGVAGGAGYLGSDSPAAGAGAAALGFLGPRAIQAAYLSGTGGKYLGNRMVPNLMAEDKRRALARLLAQGSAAGASVYSEQ
jgi:hypothetical protein